MGSRRRIVAAGFVVAVLGLLGAAAASALSPAAKPPSPPGRTSTDTKTTATTDTGTTFTGTTTDTGTTTRTTLTGTTATTASPVAPTVVTPTLYAATGGSCTNASLYTLDSTTAAPTKVGDITVNSTQVVNVTGLAVDPTNEQMYGWMNAQNCSRSGGTLLEINKADGTATIVGSEGAGGIQASDLTFDKYGQLYAWSGGCGDNSCNSNGSDLYMIDKAAGTSTKVSESGTLGFQTALAVDSKNRMYMKSYQALFRVDQYTGHVFSIVSNGTTLFNRARNVLAFGPGDVLYTHTFSDQNNQLETLDPATGNATTIGSTGLTNLSAIEWDFGSVTPPGVADLSLTKSVTNATPTAGTNVDFTITVTNGGPDSATGVVVKDKLPSGFTYVSDNASGAYASSTGLWTIGTIANAGSATLIVTATALAAGNHTNDAEVVDTTTADPDSVPGSGEGDTFASKRSAPAGSPALYAVTGSGPQFCGGSPSYLYELDPTDAAATKVADITIGGDPVTHVTGLRFDPTSGQLYGFMNFQDSDCSLQANSQGTLISIDKATGAATVIGSMNAAGIQSPDMTFTPDGHLYAWGENTDDLYQLDTSTGTSSLVGDCGCGTSQTGLAADSVGRMYLKSGTSLVRIDQFTGQQFGSTTILSPGGAQNMLAFGPSDSLYTGFRSFTTNQGATFTFTLKQIDPSTGAMTGRGSNALWDVAALAWDLGTTSVNIADLSINKTADITSPSDWGTNITFTITVTNDGPDDATGVQVYDPVPSGFTYVSNTPSQGTYDHTTGIWNVGTVSATGGSNTETLQLVLSINPTGNWQNTAEVVDSTSYDPDSVPSSTAGDTIASKTITPTANPNIDAAASLTVNGPTHANSKSKGFTVKVTNVGSQSFSVGNGNMDVEVDNSTSTVSCATFFSATLNPGKSTKFRCTWSPVNFGGISPGDTVTYTATVNVPTDGFTNNDSSTVTVTAA
jgi:large repetitive protein